ncbi:RNA polymerase II transcription mediator complex subunit 9-domain-containing protein [Schizothecium vesticola]|uniref:Mediator of RNA polymerase II transcription subunit 9 n=1 Tax=Schizothecium vesticola TaxID=314040 RepID=A0AA40F2C5_9PEZI|nr:RNA polymerase II transcription mediator complex subunit 9-domain-containing protein [Schizothecium vesticola]
MTTPAAPPIPLLDGLTPDSVDTLTELTTLLTKLRATQAAAGSTQAASQAARPGSVKELPAATDSLKHKLQRARAATRQLPDISRTIAQQEAEIEELEARRRTQLRELARIRGEGLQFSIGEQSRGEYDGERMVE